MTRPRPAPGGGRLLGVAPERLGRWLDGVADRHGAFTDVRVDGGDLLVACADGTTVRLTAPAGWTAAAPLLTSFTVAAGETRRTGVLLVRRGRWAVGVFAGAGANLIEVEHQREGVDLHVRQTGVHATFEVRSTEHAREVVSAAAAAGYGELRVETAT